MSTIEAIKKYYSTPERPVTNAELMELKRGTKMDAEAVDARTKQQR